MLLAFCAATTQHVQKVLTFLGICYFTAFHNMMCFSAVQTHLWRHWEVEEPWDSQLGTFWSETLFRMSSEATQRWLFTTVHSHKSNLRKGFWRLIYSCVQPNYCFNYRLLLVQVLPREKHNGFLFELQAGAARMHDTESELYILPLTNETASNWDSLGTGRMRIWQDWICKLFENLWHFFVFWLQWHLVLKMFLYLFNGRKTKAVPFFFLRVFAHDTHTRNKFLQNKNGLFIFIFLAL